MNHSYHQIKEEFSRQLSYMEENIQELMGLYQAATPIQERKKNFFNLYILEVEELLAKNNRNRNFSHLPKVFIGTKVTVWYDEDHEAEEYVICFPEQSDPDSGYISFLSPVGKQLLLKNVGEKISLKIPSGNIPVTIKEVSYCSQCFQEKRTKEA